MVHGDFRGADDHGVSFEKKVLESFRGQCRGAREEDGQSSGGG